MGKKKEAIELAKKLKEEKRYKLIENICKYSIIIIICLFVGYKIGRAGIRMVDDPKPVMMKLKDVNDGTVMWSARTDSLNYEIGDIIKDPDRTVSNGTFSMIREGNKYVIIQIKK